MSRLTQVMPWSPDRAAPQVPGLVTQLQQLGVEIPHIDDYKRVMDVQMPPGPWPAKVLGLTTAEMQQVAIDNATRQLASESIGNQIGRLREEARVEMAAVIREHADDLIMQMRTQFDPAADAARALRDAGVQPNDGAEQMLSKAPEVIEAWRTFRTKDFRTLEAVLSARLAMSTIAAVPPVVLGLEADAIDYSVTVLRPPWSSSEYASRFVGAQQWSWWLTMASELHLATSDELSELDHLHALGHSTAMLEATVAAHFADRGEQ